MGSENWVCLILVRTALLRIILTFQIQGMYSDVATMRKARLRREASRIAGEEGFRAFWKGNLVMIAHRLPYSSVNFYSYEQYKKVCKNTHSLSKLLIIISWHLVHWILCGTDSAYSSGTGKFQG